MLKIVISVMLLLTLVVTQPLDNFMYDAFQTENGMRYFFIPTIYVNQNGRIKRQTTASIGSDGAKISHTENLLNNKKHSFDGTAVVSKEFGGPLITSGSLDYVNKPLGSETSLKVNNNGVGLSQTGTIFDNKNHQLDGKLNANKQFDGRLSTSGSLDYIHKPTGSLTSLKSNDNGIKISQTGTLLDNKNHHLDGSAFANKQFGGSLTTGGSLDYINKPTGSGITLDFINTRGLGTDFGAKANYSLFNSRDGRTSVGILGEYRRPFSGPGASNYGAYGYIKHTFN